MGSRATKRNSPIMIDNDPDNVPEGNQRRIEFLLVISQLPKISTNDLPALRKRFYDYLDLCVKYNMKVGNMAAYAAIGIDKADAYEWSNRNLGNPARTAFIKKVQKVCAMYREGLMEDGKVNPVTGIFWQKNYDGMKDQQEVVLTPNTSPLGEQKDAEALKQKYLENTYGVAELPEGAALELPESAEGQKEPVEEITTG